MKKKGGKGGGKGKITIFAEEISVRDFFLQYSLGTSASTVFIPHFCPDIQCVIFYKFHFILMRPEEEA